VPPKPPWLLLELLLLPPLQDQRELEDERELLERPEEDWHCCSASGSPAARASRHSLLGPKVESPAARPPPRRTSVMPVARRIRQG
jgi:hypothetical protein